VASTEIPAVWVEGSFRRTAWLVLEKMMSRSEKQWVQATARAIENSRSLSLQLPSADGCFSSSGRIPDAPK